MEELPDYGKIELPLDLKPIPLRSLMPHASDEAVSLCEGMLRYNDSLRTQPVEALRSGWILKARRQPATTAELLPQMRVNAGAAAEEAAVAAGGEGGAAARRRQRAGLKPVRFPQEVVVE